MTKNKVHAVVLTDYWNEKFNHRPYRSHFHDPDSDEPRNLHDVLDDAVEASGAEDGDEVILVIVKTGRRPFGEHRVRWVEPHRYEREKTSPLSKKG